MIFETVFTLQRHYKVPKAKIRDLVLPIVQLAAIVMPGKQKLADVFDLYVDQNVPFIDAYHAVLMERLGIVEIVSFDRDYDRLPNIRRVEP